MKIVIDSKTGECKVGSKTFNELSNEKKDLWKTQEIERTLRNFLVNNTELTDYEEDCMWMSYRYCIGRHTGTSIMHAGNIWANCKDRMSKERQIFTAFDINREIEWHLNFMKPHFHFPVTSLNRIYTTAVDIVCEFMEDYNITSVEEFLKYRDVHIILTDNERGYKFEVVTWEEYLRPQILKIMQEFYNNDCMTEDYAWDLFKKWQSGIDIKNQSDSLDHILKSLNSDMPNPEHYYFHDFEDLFAWNDLVHCFDFEHYHKSILTDGSEVEWFWTWTEKTEQREDGYYYKTFGYKKVRVPIDKWKSCICTYIPDESIIKDLY